MNRLKGFIQRYKSRIDTQQVQWLLFFLILGLGIFARTWQYRSLPPGLNADEASNGVDAVSIYRYGTDRNGVSYPIKFISWGSGQDALYGYLLIPVVAFLGLTPTTVRLPMLITGILTMPLLFYVAEKTLNRQFALLSMFFLSISPWHILLSRWGLEANLFPFVFLAGYACLLNVKKSGKWAIPACILFGLCLYAYGTAYAMIPIFMICAITILMQSKLIKPKNLIIGLLAFAALAAPIGMLIIINFFNMNSLRLGPVTIPRFPVQARFETETIFSATNPIQAGLNNLWAAIKLLSTQSDGLLYNVVDPYGYFYKITFPFALIGIVLLIAKLKGEKRLENKLLLAWIGASMSIAIIQQVNINRFNIIFIPLLLCIALSIQDGSIRFRPILIISVCAFLFGFVFFTIAYHDMNYRDQADRKFYTGILPALDFARQLGDNPICVTDKFNMPYIFALFSEQANPADYLASIKYIDPQAPLRQVLSFGRYTFGIKNCEQTPKTVFILLADENRPRLGEGYRIKDFSNFILYYPALK